MSHRMDFRRLTQEDAEAFWQLRSEALEFEPQAFTESMAQHLAMPITEVRGRLGSGSSDDNFVLGAFDGEQLVGMAGFFRRQGEKICHRGEIWGLYIGKQYRGRRFGQSLLAELIIQLRSVAGLEQVALGVSAGNTAAKRLYESLGFETYGREARALKIGEHYLDEELMVLYLRNATQ